MQESILKGFERLKELKEPDKYVGWQKQISLRFALGILRHKKNGVSFFRDIKDENKIENDDGNSLLQIDVKTVHHKIGKLPEGYRMTIQLHLIEGWSHDEIGESLGIAASTSRSQYSRGMALLKKELLAEYEKQF